MVSSEKTDMFRQYISFDIDTGELEKYYPMENWRNAYEDIKEHMLKHGFVWLQGSGYISKEPMTTIKAHKVIMEFSKNNLWIHKCMRDCRVLDVGKSNNLNALFDKSIDVPMRADYQKANRESQKKHIQELKRNGFQPSKTIISQMQQMDKISGRYVGLQEIRDIFKGNKADIPAEYQKLANDIGNILKSQELARVSYR